MVKLYAVIVAGGNSERIDSGIPKQFMKIEGQSILEITLKKFQDHHKIDHIILVVNHKHTDYINNSSLYHQFPKIQSITYGGINRQLSVYNGLKSIDQDAGLVIIHDVARPFFNINLIDEHINLLENHKAVTTSLPLHDTIYQINDGKIEKFPNRENFLLAQTPQSFHFKEIIKAHRLAQKSGEQFSDDISLFKNYDNSEIGIIMGNKTNFKITTMEDYEIAKILYKHNDLL